MHRSRLDVAYGEIGERLPTLSRRIYWGYRESSRLIVNSLINKALAVCPPSVLKTARRYPLSLRSQIYKACCTGGLRVEQIANTFPIAAVLAYTDRFVLGELDENRASRTGAFREEIRDLVQKGARLRIIADALGCPKVLRQVAPRLAVVAIQAGFNDSANWAPYMPRKTPQQRCWLKSLAVTRDLSPDFRLWVARHALEFGPTPAAAVTRVLDIADWIKAGIRAVTPKHVQVAFGISSTFDRAHVTRPFNKNMSVGTVEKLSGDWHEAVARGQAGHEAIYSAPWYPETRVLDYSFVPITSTTELYAEGRAMHNCVATYEEQILKGRAFFYSVRQGSDRIATVMLRFVADNVTLGDMRAPCNAVVDKKTARVVRRWLREVKPSTALGNAQGGSFPSRIPPTRNAMMVFPFDLQTDGIPSTETRG